MSLRKVNAVLNDIQESARTEGISGCWPGRVEDTDDPKRMSRVRVRVFAFHGGKNVTPTIALPWAESSSLNGGGYDYGSSGQLYPVGSNVWVIFAMGKVESPVVMGGCRSRKRVKDDKNDGQILTLDGTSPSGADDTWIPDEDSELPKDVHEDFSEGDNHPTRTVWQKSFKGHTITVEDRDGFEHLRIIDRVGQVFEMDCPVTVESNRNNLEQRGVRNAVDDSQVSQDSLVNGRAYIRLKDVAGQEVILDGKANDEQIRIVSRNRFNTSRQTITLSSSKGRELIEIKDKQGNQIRFDPNGEIPISIEDYTGNKLEFDAESGQVRITSVGGNSEVTANNKNVTVGGKLTSLIGGDEELKTIGKKLINVVSDLTATVGGVTALALVGPMQLQIANSQLPAGTPALTGLDLEVVVGDVSMGAKTGAWAITAPLGVAIQGAVSSSESAALGDSISSALQELYDIFSSNSTNFGIGNMGGPVPINPKFIADLLVWVTKYVTTPATNVVSQLHSVSRL